MTVAWDDPETTEPQVELLHQGLALDLSLRAVYMHRVVYRICVCILPLAQRSRVLDDI